MEVLLKFLTCPSLLLAPVRCSSVYNLLFEHNHSFALERNHSFAVLHYRSGEFLEAISFIFQNGEKFSYGGNGGSEHVSYIYVSYVA